MYNDFTYIDTSVTNVSAINNAINNILNTKIGSVPGRPDFGSNIHRILFNQLDHITENLLKNYIKEALNLWEPRIFVHSVNVTSVSEYNKIVADIYYRYRDDGVTLNGSTSISISQ